MRKMEMTKITHPAYFASGKNLGSLISFAELEGEKEGLYIVELFLNGKKLPADEEDLLDRLGVSEVESLEVLYKTITEITFEMFSATIGLLQEIRQKCYTISENFALTNQLPKSEITQIFVLSKTLMDSLEEVYQAHLNKRILLKHVALWRESEKEFSSILQCVLKSFESDESKFVVELLKFEFSPCLAIWEDIIEKEILDNPQLSQTFQINGTTSAPREL